MSELDLIKEYEAGAEKLEAAAKTFKEEMDRIFKEEQEVLDSFANDLQITNDTFTAAVERCLLITTNGFWGKGLIPPMSSPDKPKSGEIKVTEKWQCPPGRIYHCNL